MSDEPFGREARTTWRNAMKLLYSPRTYELAAVFLLVVGLLNASQQLVYIFINASKDAGFFEEVVRNSLYILVSLATIFMGVAICIAVAQYLRQGRP